MEYCSHVQLMTPRKGISRLSLVGFALRVAQPFSVVITYMPAQTTTKGTPTSRPRVKQQEASSTTFIKYIFFVFCLVCSLHTFHYITNGDPLASPYINGQYLS